MSRLGNPCSIVLHDGLFYIGADSSSSLPVGRRFSMTCFYSDSGPREEWDAPLTKHAKHVHKSRAFQSRLRTVAKEECLNPSQVQMQTLFMGHFHSHFQSH